MALQNVTVAIPAATWTQLTPADATLIRVQNQSQSRVWLMGTIAAGPAPAVPTGAIFLNPGERSALTLSADFVGILLCTRLWAYSETAASVAVSNA